MDKSSIKADSIFWAALDICEHHDQQSYLDEVCGDDDALKAQLNQMLAAYPNAQHFLESPAVAVPNAALDHMPAAVIGRQIGHYKLLEQLGEGGMGVVYVAEQTAPVKRKVALKVIKPGMDSQLVIARFEAERQALAMMDHPSIARIFDAGATETGCPFFVMELVKGAPLTEFCDQHQLATAERLELFSTVCQAVQHAHQKGIIHRDLKPSNVLATFSDGKPIVKVIDFGVAKAVNQQLTEKTLFTACGQMVGTPQYMSPEQAEMSSLDVDSRSDVYSLGVLLYELLTGTTPLEAERLRAAGYAEMQRIIQEEVPPKPSTRLTTSGEKLSDVARLRNMSPHKLASIIKGDLDWIVMRALEKDRSRRYGSPSEFSAEIGRFLRNEPLTTRPPSAYRQFQSFYRRHRVVVSTLSVIAAAILIGTGLAVYGLLEATTEAQNAKMAQRRASNALSVLRDVAKDQAMATALAGDTERTRVLLETGEAAGLDESDLGLVRALEAFVGGDPERSLELLAPVFAKEPNSVSAMGLAAIAHASVGRDDQHAEFVDRLRRLRPSTADEYLLMGRAMIDKAQSRRLVDRAFELRPTPTSLLFKAEAHILWAHDKNRPLEAKDTLRFVDAAEVFLGETSYTLFLRLMADHLLSKHTSGLESGKHSRAASKTADKLLEGPVEVIVPVYYADVGLYETALNAWSEVGVAGTSNSQYIAALLHRSEPDAQVALAHFDRLTARDAANTWVRASRLILRAEADHELDALRAEVRTLIQETKDMPQMQFALLNACFHVGDLGLQQVLARRLASSSSSQFDDWGMRAAIEFLAGEPTEARIDAALAKVASSREGECVLRCVIAQRLLFEAGHRDLAIDQLRKCLNTDIMISLEYNWASAYLHRLTTDPKWPSWINPNTREGHQ